MKDLNRASDVEQLDAVEHEHPDPARYGRVCHLGLSDLGGCLSGTTVAAGFDRDDHFKQEGNQPETTERRIQ